MCFNSEYNFGNQNYAGCVIMWHYVFALEQSYTDYFIDKSEH